MDGHAIQTPVNVISAEEYDRKRAQIQAAKEFLERMEGENEAGGAQYEAELLQKIREGEEARQRLQDLERHRNSRVQGSLRIEAPPTTARIEELPFTSPQVPSGQFSTGRTSVQTSFQSSRLPPGYPSTLPPSYHSLIQHPSHITTQPYYGIPFRHFQPTTQNPLPESSQVQPGFYHHMQTMNRKQQGNSSKKPAVQHQKSFATRQTLSQIPTQSQTQAAGVQGSFSVPQACGIGSTCQDLQSPVHYTPTGVHPVSTSSLTGALGPQTTQTQGSASPSIATSVSSPAPPGRVSTAPQVAQVPNSKSAPSLDSHSASASLSPSLQMEDRKSKILAFRSSILEWVKASPPNTYTEFFKIKVYKAFDSMAYITSLSNGKEVVEEQNSFFERLWVTAGLPLDDFPFKQGSMSGPPALNTIAAGHSTPSTVPRAITTPKPSFFAQQGAGGLSSPVPPLPTRISPETPRPRTLVDPVTDSWRSPADADKKRLARDLMHALGKRKQDSVSNGNPAKRQALESTSVHHISKPVIQKSTTMSPVTITEAIQEPVLPVVPRSQPIEPPPPPTVVTPLVAPNSQTDPLQNTSGPSNSQQLVSFPTSVVRSAQDGNDVIPPQDSQQSKHSLSKEATTTPSQTLPIANAPTTSFASPPQGPEKLGLFNATSGVPGPVSSSSDDLPSSLPSSSIRAAVDPKPPKSPAGSLLKSELPSRSQVIGSQQDIPSSSNSTDDTSRSVLPSGFDLSQKASTSNVPEPLFLPSPSPSPALPAKKKKGRSSVYVLVPPPPEYLIRYRKRKSMKDKLDSQTDSIRRSSVMSTSITSRSLEDLSSPLSIDPHEHDAVQLSCSRLQPVSCRWGECDIVLNSVDTLIHHLNREHKPDGLSFICRWTQCGRQCRSQEKHLEKHAMMTLRCAYKGCKDSFRASSQLLKHFWARHLNGVHKTRATPFHHEYQPPLPLPNSVLPYLVVTPQVMASPISPDKHSILGPWVLHNIVEFDGDFLQRARRSNSSSSTANASNKYQFLEMRSMRYSWNQSKPVEMEFDDLHSEEISKECDQGLTFFDTENSEVPPSDEERLPSSLFSSPRKVKTIHTERLDWHATDTEPSDEEEIIEKLLLE